MTPAEARALVAVLVAAFPRQRIEQATTDLYATSLVRLRREPAADAVRAIAESARYFPTLGDIREEYGRFVDRYSQPALPEPELSEAERRENLRRIRELAAGIGRKVEP